MEIASRSSESETSESEDTSKSDKSFNAKATSQIIQGTVFDNDTSILLKVASSIPDTLLELRSGKSNKVGKSPIINEDIDIVLPILVSYLVSRKAKKAENLLDYERYV